jgi:hypothetical protein
MREDGDLRGSIVLYVSLNEKYRFLLLTSVAVVPLLLILILFWI